MANLKLISSIIIGIMFSVFFSEVAYAHCDTLDGPVVVTAKKALEKGDVTPVLKWVRKEYETEIKDLFKKTMTVRSKGKEAQELADMYFLETLVRLHRTGEGEPYTGLKSAGHPDIPAIESDKALETGKADNLIKIITEEAEEGIRKRFSHALEKKKHADETVEAGREFVEAYVEFLHYVERLYLDMKVPAEGHGPAAGFHKKEHKDHGIKEHKHQ